MKRTQLAVVANIEAAVTPKPTKNEIISAMAQVKQEELAKAARENATKRDALLKEVKKELVEFLLKKPDAHSNRVSFGWRSSINGKKSDEFRNTEVEFTLSNIPRAIVKKMVQVDDLNGQTCVPDIKRIKMMIRDKMGAAGGTPEARIQALCSTPAVRSDLEKMLKHIGA